jgi:hypothetical protein
MQGYLSLLKSKYFYITLFISIIYYFIIVSFFGNSKHFLVCSEKSEINFNYYHANNAVASFHLVFTSGHKTDGICKVTAAEIKFIKISSGHSLIN